MRKGAGHFLAQNYHAPLGHGAREPPGKEVLDRVKIAVAVNPEQQVAVQRLDCLLPGGHVERVVAHYVVDDIGRGKPEAFENLRSGIGKGVSSDLA